MRRRFGLLWALLTLAVVGAAGWFAYNAGLAQGQATTGPDRTPVNPGYYPYYPHPWGFGFGFFPLLLFILLLVFLFRRLSGHRHWGGYGGHDGNSGRFPGDGQLPPPMEDHLRAWHEKAHGTVSPSTDAGQPAKPG